MLPSGIELEQDGSCVTVRVRLAELSHEDFQETIAEASERMRYDKALQFIFDLEAVLFMPSSCLSELLSFRQEVEHCRGRIALVLKDGNINTLLKITRLDEVFALFDDLQEAIGSLSGAVR